MERLIPVIGLALLSSAAWAQLSSPVIMSQNTASPSQPVSSGGRPPQSATPPAARPSGYPAQSYIPSTLSPQAQINATASKASMPSTTPSSRPTSGQRLGAYPPNKGQTESQSQPQAGLFRQPMTDVNHITNTSDTKPKKKLEFRKKKEGRAVYFININQPRVEITLFSGACYASNRRELRQQLLDRGLDTRKKTNLRAAYAMTPTGREKGCWYYVRQGDYFRVALENGQGEDFAREQIDRAR